MPAAAAHPPEQRVAPEPTRLEGIDILRGSAIVMMIAYHFCYDLVLFRWANWRMLQDPGWIAWRSVILSSFLLLAGVSLVLRARFKPSWRDFRRRWAQIAGAALLVTVGSAIVFPRTFIYFGVLHHVALMLVVARLMLPLGSWNALIGSAVLAIGAWVSIDAMNPKWINWIGLISVKPHTEDYVPIFPWFGVMLIGVALGRTWAERGMPRIGALASLRALLPAFVARGLGFLGRWSLTTYLAHQPILLGALWLAAAAAR